MPAKTVKAPQAHVEQTFWNRYVVKIGTIQIYGNIDEATAIVIKEQINEGIRQWIQKHA